MASSSLAYIVSQQGQLSAELQTALESAENGLASRRVLQVGGDQLLSRLQQAGDSLPAVLIDLDAGDSAVELLKHVRKRFPGIRLAATAGADASGEAVLAAMRAGSAEFVAQPFENARLAAWLEPKLLLAAKAELESKPATTGGKLICFVGAQGANGVSTAALHAGYALVNERDEKALLLELDFHSGALAYRLGIRPQTTMSDLARQAAAGPAAWRQALCCWQGLDLLPAPQSGSELLSGGPPPIDEILDEALEAYDAVLADLPAAMLTSTRAVLARADRVYLLCSPDRKALHLARRRLEELTDIGVSPRDVRLTVNRSGASGAIEEEEVAKVVGVPIGYSLPNDYAAASAAEAEGRLVADDTELGADLLGLGWHILDEVRPKKSKKRSVLEWFFRG